MWTCPMPRASETELSRGLSTISGAHKRRVHLDPIALRRAEHTIHGEAKPVRNFVASTCLLTGFRGSWPWMLLSLCSTRLSASLNPSFEAELLARGKGSISLRFVLLHQLFERVFTSTPRVVPGGWKFPELLLPYSVRSIEFK